MYKSNCTRRSSFQQYGTIIVLFIGLSFTHGSYAVDCREIDNVKLSGESKNNNAAGGHLNQHIFGAIPPEGSSQAGKTLFTSVQEYSGFWKNFIKPQTQPSTSIKCAGSKGSGRVTVASVLSKNAIGAFSCTAAAADGQCTEKTRRTLPYVQLYFVNLNSKWILQTAYPVGNN